MHKNKEETRKLTCQYCGKAFKYSYIAMLYLPTIVVFVACLLNISISNNPKNLKKVETYIGQLISNHGKLIKIVNSVLWIVIIYLTIVFI